MKPQLPTTPPLPGVIAVPTINEAFQTIGTDFSGDTDPAAYSWPYSKWADTSSGLLKRRNAAGTAWVAEAVLFRLGLTMYAQDEIPSVDSGDIFVQGLGRHSWLNGRYVPNNFSPLHRAGGTLAVASSTSISVAPGSWRSAAGSSDLILPSAMTKVLQSSGAWAAGTGNNGLFSGAAATSTWYHVHAIRNDATGAVDIGFDVSPIAANRPSGWSAYRRVGSVFNQSVGGILPFIQDGTLFRFMTPKDNLSNSGLNIPTLITMTVPLGVRCLVNVLALLGAQTGNCFAFVFSADESDRTDQGSATVSSNPNVNDPGSTQVMSNTSSQVYVRGTGTIPSGFSLRTAGYYDFIGD
ncbi:hypothetical protein [Achromobacter xylosoxidans]|uniref:hypothetical protein n=1 Tax=Alcaligenes xylosoxydans xylosoxydans TaxID=85698 RepID=UPI002955A71A|nr:hypothetical protein [Achromobacter xylosoxidans]